MKTKMSVLFVFLVLLSAITLTSIPGLTGTGHASNPARKTYWLSLPAHAFRPRSSKVQYQIDAQGRLCPLKTGHGNEFAAPIYLPQGAEIMYLQASVSLDGAHLVSTVLYELPFKGTTFVPRGTAQGTGRGDKVLSSKRLHNVLTDTQNAYVVEVTLPTPKTKLRGVKLMYSMVP